MADLKERLRAAQSADRENLADRVSSAQSRLKTGEEGITKGEAFRLSAFDKAIELMQSAPDVAGQALADAGSLVPAAFLGGEEALVNMMRGEPANFSESFNRHRQGALQTPPLSWLADIPGPDPGMGAELRSINAATSLPRDVNEFAELAAGQRPGFGGRLERAREEEAIRTEQAELLFPGFSQFGRDTTDVAALVSGRNQRGIAQARAATMQKAREAVIGRFSTTMEQLPVRARDQIQDVFSSRISRTFADSIRNLERAGVKAGEAGIEGSLLAIVNDGSPEAAFGLSAGTQAAGSLALFLGTAAIKHPVGAVATAFVAAEMLKAAGPGDQGFFESKDFAIQKAVLAFSVSALAAMSGLGRIRGPAAERMPEMMDAITSVPRGFLLSRIQAVTNESKKGNDVPQKVLNAMSNADKFNDNQQNALFRAWQKDGQAFIDEVGRLTRDSEDFRQRIDDL